MMKKIGDLIEVPEVKTVIQLKDTEDAHLRELLARNFLITDEVALFFKSFFSSILEREGRGFFVEGNFGSGKSHLLSILGLSLSYPEAWQPLLEQDSGVEKLLARTREEITSQDFLVVQVSLVEHSNREYLEDIITSEIKEVLQEKGLQGPAFHREQEFIQSMVEMVKTQKPSNLKSVLREREMTEEELFASTDINLWEEILDRLNLPYRLKYNRQETFSRLGKSLSRGGYAGIVFLIDELSEFLRSKTDSRRFNEDIRFLQFLGEYSQNQPVWIVATLQEEIEKTGETTPEAFNKIKDRYPFRFRLTGSHIRELISQRLIRLKPGAVEEIEGIYSFYQNSFARWETSREDFLRLYPVHPLTIDLIDNLKPLFSQHRGIIDFIHYRLKGDPRRNFSGLLDEDSHTLLTPDRIFDHFQDRIREMVETNPYLEKVFSYYQQEMRDILDPEDQGTGLALVKLLILFKISPLATRYTVEDMANMLLHQVTDLDPEVNYQNISDILEKMHQNGAYIGKKEGNNFREDFYFIDLEADTNLLLQRKVEFAKNNIFTDDHRLFTRLGLLVNHRSLPLGEILENPWTLRDFTWQNTSRKGYLLLSSYRDLNRDKLEELQANLKQREEDFLIVLGHAREIEKEKEYLNDVILPELEEGNREAIAFWTPGEVKNPELLREILARLIVYDEYREDNTSTGQEIKETVKQQLQEDREKLNSLFLEAYLYGEIIGGDGEEFLNLKEVGLLPWDNILEKVAFRILGRRFPQHIKIAPFQSYLNSSQVKVLEEKFLVQGEIDIETAQSTGLIRVIDGFLKPMDLVAKKQRNILLQIRPEKNPLIQNLFKELKEEKTEFKPLYWRLRKGPFGISQSQFNLLILSMLYGGYLTAYTEKKKISLKNFNSSHLARVQYIGYGEIIRDDCQEILQSCVLLPPRLKNQPFSLPLQQTVWEFLTDKKQEMVPQLENLQYKINDLESKGELGDLSLQEFRKTLSKVENLLDEIKVSYSAEEGLERFATAYRNMPGVEKNLEQMEQLRLFIEENLSEYLQMKRYLQHPDLLIPQEEKYENLKKNLDNLQESLKDQAIIIDSQIFKATRDNFRRFKNEYKQVYSQEHQVKLGEERFKPYWEKKKTTGYRVLQLLSRVELISVKNDLVKVDRLLARALSRNCQVFSPENLEHTPTCNCGFSLGTKVELPSLQLIQETIEAGIKEYIEAIQEKGNRKKINEYLQNMEEAGEKKSARPLKTILQLNPENRLIIKELDKNLNQEVIDRINKALAGEISLVRRDLDELYENIVDRSFTPAQLQRIFQEWLEGMEKLEKNTYVRVVSGEGKLPREKDKKEKLAGFIEKRYPELAPYFKTMEEDFFLFLAGKSWEKKHGIELDGLFGDNLQKKDFIQKNPPPEESITNLIEDILAEEELLRILQGRVDEMIQDRHLLSDIFEIMELDSLKKIAKVLEEEEISPLIMQEALVQLIKKAPEEMDHAEIKKIISLKEEENFSGKINHLARSYLDLETGLQNLKGIVNSSDITEWSKVFRGPASSLERNYSIIENLAREIGIEDRVPLELKFRDIFRTLAASNKKFQNSYRNLKWDAFPETGEITELTSLVLKRYPRFCQKVKSENAFLVLLDGARWDVWEEIWKEAKKHVTLRTIDQGSLIARKPTNTETQLEALQEAGFSGQIVSPEWLNLETKKTEDIIKFNFIDERIHSEKKDLNYLFSDLVFQARKTLVPFLKEIPSYSLILVFSDHGFSINYDFPQDDKYQEARYYHGSITLPEVIVPWTCFYLV